MTRRQELKKMIRAFMQNHYTDERLAQLLCHARDGKLAFFSCCCFIGVATADHALAGQMSGYSRVNHYLAAARLDGAIDAERAYCELMAADWGEKEDVVRRRILIPMIRAEMKRRANRTEQPTAAEPEAEKLEQMRVTHYELSTGELS